MQRLIYIANIRLPTEKAHGIQIMKTCEALARQGAEVELVVPRRLNHIKDDPFAFYGVAKNFKIIRLWCLDLISLDIFGALGFWIESWTFYRSVKKYLNKQSGAIYYTRDLPMAYWLSKEVSPVFYEIHTLPDRISSKYKEVWERCKGLIVISGGLKNALLKQGVAESKILVAHDAVDLRQFKINETKEECRKKLGLPPDDKIVIYTGHLYEWKGAEVLIEAAGELYRKMGDTIQIYIVGGTAQEVSIFKKKYHNHLNLHIIGWEKLSLMPYWQHAADVLVLPTSAREKIGRFYTSPMKLFEYMMSRCPIVASDIPSLREVLDESVANFFIPDDPSSLAEKIQAVLANPEEGEERALRAYSEVLRKYTWDKRAQTILEFLRVRI